MKKAKTKIERKTLRIEMRVRNKSEVFKRVNAFMNELCNKEKLVTMAYVSWED
jgi:hypothetical protein